MTPEKPITLEIVQDLPAMPLLVVAADTIARVETLASSVRTLIVTSPEQANNCGAIMREASELAKAIEAKRVECKAPVIELERKIDAAARKPLDMLAQVWATASDRLRQWEAAEAARRAEEERKRQAELARIEAERRRIEAERIRLEQVAEQERRRKEREAAEEAERQRKAAEAPAKEEDPFDVAPAPIPVTKSELDDFGDFSGLAARQNAAKAEELARREAELSAPVVVAPKPAGITYRTTLKFEITNLAALPAEFVTRTANEAAIRGRYCVGFNERQPLPTVPGVRFYVKKDHINLGRR
jgi:hypothetical protein